MATALRTPSRITTSRLSTLRWMTRTPSRTRTRTTRTSEHAAHRPLMHSVHIALWLKIASCVSSTSSMHAHLCLASWLFSPRLSRFLPRLTVPLPALPDVHLQRPTRGPCPTPCATPAWGAWSHPTTSHPSHLPRREREWIKFYNKKWVDSWRKEPQERKTSGILHFSEPDGMMDMVWENSTRSKETKDRAIQEYLETPSKYRILVQFEARSRERLAIFQTRSHAVVLYNTLGHHQAIRKVSGKLVTTPWMTENLEYLFLQSSSRHKYARTKSRSCSRSSRTTNIKNHSIRIWARRRRSRSSAKESQDFDCRLEQHRDLRTLRNFFQTAMSLSAMPTAK